MATLTGKKKTIEEMAEEINRGAKSSSSSVSGQKNASKQKVINNTSVKSVKDTNRDFSLIDAYMQNQKKQSFSAPSSKLVLPYTRDEMTIKDYESIPNYNVFERATDKSKADAYNRKQSMLPSYKEAKSRTIEKSLKQSGLTDSEIEALSSGTFGNKSMVGLDLINAYMNRDKRKAALEKLKNSGSRNLSASDILDYAQSQSRKKETQELSDFSDKHKVIGTALTFPMNAGGGVSGLVGNTVDYLTGNPIDPENYANHNTNTSNQMRSAVSDDMGKAGQFLYNVGTSIGDSLTSQAISGGKPAVAAALQGSQAFTNSAIDTANRGLTPNQIMATSSIAAAAETVFEKLSLDNLKGIVKGGTAKEAGKSLFKDILSQMASEGGEEMATEVANAAADYFINGELSNFVQSVEQYQNTGMSEDDAKKQAWKDLFGQIAYAGAAGAVSGGIMGGGASLINKVSGKSNVSSNDSTNSAETTAIGELKKLDPLNAFGLQKDTDSIVDTSNQVDYNNNVTDNNVSLSNRGDIDVINNEQANERSRNETAGNLRDSSSGSSENDIAVERGRTDGGTDTSLRGVFHVINENSRSALNKIGVTDNEFRETTGNPELFSFALESGKLSNANGVMVDSHTADELRNEGAITFLAKDNMSGGAVMPDGNITAVFKNSKSKSRRAGVDIITTALENGGNKLDCYGKNLLSLYASLGFEPVARVKFNAEYAPEGWDFDKFGMLDIYVMKHNGQSTDLVVSNLESGNIKTYTEAEIENLPYMEYDEAMSYRDSLIAANNNQASRTNQSQTNAVHSERLQNDQNTASSDMVERIRAARENLRAENIGDSSQRVRGYNDTLINKTDAPQVLKNEFINNPDFYTQLSNKDTAARANEILANNDIDSAINQYRILLDKKDPVAVPLGYNLSKQLSQTGRLDESVQLVREMSRALTESGQFSQAAAITLMHNDPEAAKRYLIREIDTLNQKGKEKYGKKWTDFELTESELQQFSNIESGDTDAIKSAYEAVYDRLRKQYPSTMTEKLMEFRRIAMLLNGRTDVRNFVSNVLLFPVRWTADRVSALGEGFYSLINPKYSRTQSINPIRSKQSKKLASEAFETVKAELLGDNKYEDSKGAIRDKQVFKGSKTAQMLDTLTGGAITKANQAMGKSIDPSLLETARNFTYYLLEKGDNVFVKKNFESRMASYLDAQGITELENIPADAYVLATQEAMKATFKDDTKLSNILSDVRRKLGVAGEIVLPFTKTPANLAMRGIDYSPAGALIGLNTIIKAKSNTDIAKGITQLGQAVTGTAAIALGYALAEAGIITGALSEDKDEAQFQKQQGMLPYAFKIGENYYSYDWAQPASIPIILGVTLYDSWNNNGDAINGLKQGLLAAADSWLELSPLQNLSDIFGGYGTTAENVWSVLTTDTPLSFIPSQLGAAARIGDTTQRVTYDQTSYLNNLANQAKAKIPGLSETLPVAYDTWGNPIQRQDSTGEAAFANILNPGQLGNANVSPIDYDINALYKSTNDVSVFPRKAKWTENNVKLNNEQYSEFQRIMGENSYDMVNTFINSENYDSMDDEIKVKVIGEMYSFAHAIASSEVTGYDIAGSKSYQKEYSIFQDKGAEGVSRYYTISKSLEGTKNVDYVNAVNSLNISDEDKGYYLSKLMSPLSKSAQAAYEESGYAGIYQHYLQETMADRIKQLREQSAAERIKALREQSNSGVTDDMVQRIKELRSQL